MMTSISWVDSFVRMKGGQHCYGKPGCRKGPGGLDPLSQKLFGGRVTGRTEITPAADQASEVIFGRRLSQQEYRDLVGAPSNALVTVDGYEPFSQGDILQFEVSGPGYEIPQTRSISRRNGITTIENEVFVTNDELPPGSGTRIFARQVKTARQLGVDQIRTEASGEIMYMVEPPRKANGYYTWPRLGYDGQIPWQVEIDLPESLRTKNSSDLRISDLMRTPEGRAWWKEHGTTAKMSFDLEPGRLSGQVLQAYLDEKGIVV